MISSHNTLFLLTLVSKCIFSIVIEVKCENDAIKIFNLIHLFLSFALLFIFTFLCYSITSLCQYLHPLHNLLMALLYESYVCFIRKCNAHIKPCFMLNNTDLNHCYVTSTFVVQFMNPAICIFKNILSICFICLLFTLLIITFLSELIIFADIFDMLIECIILICSDLMFVMWVFYLMDVLINSGEHLDSLHF